MGTASAFSVFPATEAAKENKMNEPKNKGLLRLSQTDIDALLQAYKANSTKSYTELCSVFRRICPFPVLVNRGGVGTNWTAARVSVFLTWQGIRRQHGERVKKASTAKQPSFSLTDQIQFVLNMNLTDKHKLHFIKELLKGE